MADLQYQVTQLYNRLSSLNNTLTSLALNSKVNTFQTTIQKRVDILTNSLATAEAAIRDIQLDISDITSSVIG